ncbi:MAG: hypothetical protein IPM17_08570 [Verrucomicrobia bacterium]|nr:hypothetical protein [Verrucomicrobiota bacterium]
MAAFACLFSAKVRGSASLPAFDFTTAAGRTGWTAANQISQFTGGVEGLSGVITGIDPMVIGPAADYPAGQPLWLRLRLYSETGGWCQVFYFPAGGQPTEARSVGFVAPAGRWVEGRVAVPALGARQRMRIDPPGSSGRFTLASLRFEARGPLPDFDFTTVPDVGEWTPQHHLSGFGPGPDGLHMTITGLDPYFAGPPRDYPDGTPLWLHFRLRSEQGGMAQVFYYRTAPSEAESVRFYVPGGDWHEAKVRLPALGKGYRLRIDPPGSGGACIVSRLWFSERVTFAEPTWPKPEPSVLGADAPAIQSGPLRVIHATNRLGGFEVRVNNILMACGNAAPLVGYVLDGAARWFRLGGEGATVTVVGQPLQHLADAQIGGRLTARVTCADPDGATWEAEQTFRLNTAGSLMVETRVRVDQDRDVLHLPLLTLLPGLGSFGTNKTQALLAGVEYLENEPSSSTADLNPPDSNRQVPDVLKLTLPLAVVAAEGQYVGFAWNREAAINVCAFFDTPDRLFHSGAQVMGLLFPGSDGLNRDESSLLPYDTARLPANRTLTVSAILLGGEGATVVPAVRQYVELFGLASLPSPGMTATDFHRLAARGWLDSKIRDGDQYRHAAPGFGSGPAADAALWMDWLAPRVEEAALAGRLSEAARRALGLVPSGSLNQALVGHVRQPAPALVYRRTVENAVAARDFGRSLLGRFRPDGTIQYRPSAGGLDYGRTHWADHANGLTAATLVAVLEAAAFSGDRQLIAEGVRRLRQAVTNYAGTVPRGAQTWEIALHTPDILAAAHLVQSFVLGYELTAEPEFLAAARDWAWTGLPFVYLTPPTDHPVGPYATIPVLGATAWVAPNWIGLPVQWCGLVYAEALYRLARHDQTGPWRQVADGIAISGIQQTYPATDAEYLGLLPDSYNLRPQSRNGPNINPATVLAPAARWLGQPVYDHRAFLRHGLIVHAPGVVDEVQERADGVAFRVRGWPSEPYEILVVGLSQRPEVRLNGAPLYLSPPHVFQAAEGRLILRLQGNATVDIRHPAQAALRIEPARQQGRVRVFWPASAARYQLESTAGLGPIAEWARVTASPEGVGGEFAIEEPTDAAAAFYRLAR